MKAFLLFIPLLLGRTALLHAQSTPGLQPPPSHLLGSHKQPKEEAEVIPYVRELETVKLKKHEHDVPDELRVDFNGADIHISGMKKSNMSMIMGAKAGHIGKLVLLPASTRSGSLEVKIPWLRDATFYGLVVELNGDVLKAQAPKLELGPKYEWTTQIDGTDFIFELTNGEDKVVSFKEPAAAVKAFGFYATVRHPGGKADLLVTLHP